MQPSERGPSVGWGRQTQGHSADGPHFGAATGLLLVGAEEGGRGGPAGWKTPPVSGTGHLLTHTHTHTTHAHLRSLVLVTKVRNFTLDLSGCGTGGEEDGGRREEERGGRSRGKKKKNVLAET